MTTFTTTDCSNDNQLQDFINRAADGDTITFACSGTITITNTLTIKRKGQTKENLTLDGSGNSVILDGGNKVRVLRIDGMHLTLKELTVANGKTDESGGGLFISQSSEVTIENSTFSGNTALGYGGGLYNNLGGSGTVIHCTFANNTANMGGGWSTTYGPFYVSASIVSHNTATFKGKNSLFKVSSLGSNLEDGTDCGFSDPVYNDQQNTDPMLDPTGLQYNGGSTQTIALQVGSPAIGAIPIQMCPATDQRGYLRPAGNSFGDIGANQSSYLAPPAPSYP